MMTLPWVCAAAVDIATILTSCQSSWKGDVSNSMSSLGLNAATLSPSMNSSYLLIPGPAGSSCTSKRTLPLTTAGALSADSTPLTVAVNVGILAHGWQGGSST